MARLSMLRIEPRRRRRPYRIDYHPPTTTAPQVSLFCGESGATIGGVTCVCLRRFILMKAFALLAALVMGLGATVLVKAADEAKPQAPAEGKAEAKADEKTPATKPSTQAAIFNKKCPLSDEDVDPKGKTV